MTKARNMEARYHRFAAPLVLAICMLLALACLVATSSRGTVVAAPKDLEGSLNAPVGMQALSAFWAEDFSDPISSATYYITATPGSGERVIGEAYFRLTQDAAYQTGRVFYRSLAPMNEFTATFRLYLGAADGAEGADGAAFIFCPVYDYSPQVGSSLDATCPGGYIVAFDTYDQPGEAEDQVYVAHDNVGTRLCEASVPDLEDGAWHTSAVAFDRGTITVTLDASTIITGCTLPDYNSFAGYFGFSAATGWYHNEHRVDDVVVNALTSGGTISGTVVISGTSTPIAGAHVRATLVSTPTAIYNAVTDANGDYALMAFLSGTYTVTFSAYGYRPQTIAGVVVVSGTTTTQDAALEPVILHVKPDGSGDCSSWDNACALQTALASWGCEIWVATGVYTPGVSRDDTFQLHDGVALYGGFAGTETHRAERDWLAHPTVLSGDIGGDDITDPNGVVTDTANISGTNSYHVVTGSGVTETAGLDGFTITAGQADSSYPCDRGGGMYNDGSSPALTNVTFSGNSAFDGGGVYNDGGSPTLTDVTFSANAAAYSGGGMCNTGSSPALTNVTFSGNSAGVGGGMCNYSSSPTLTDVSFSGNSAISDGGGMYNYISSPALTDVSFSGNSATYSGGGMRNYYSSPALTNVSFSGNAATYGGGMLNYGSSPALTNVSFSGNSAYSGGGMYNYISSNPSARNSIFWSNQDSSGSGTITATIANDGSAITLTHSLVQGSGGSSAWTGDASYVDGGGNLDADPLFILPVDPATAPTTAGNLRLQRSSPAIDAGDNDFVTVPLDLDGNPRIADGDMDGVATVDMGAYEAPTHDLYLPLVLRRRAE